MNGTQLKGKIGHVNMRLTELNEKTGNYVYNNQIKSFQEIYNKLGKLEDLEEQIGCPLEILVKAIKNGIWFINEDDKLEYIDEALCFNTILNTDKLVFDNYGYHCKNIEKVKGNQIYLEDYKKTWWLKEDKSE